MKQEQTESRIRKVHSATPSSERVIETPRLRLRRLTIHDAPALFRTVGDPVVMRYWLGGADANIRATEQRIRTVHQHWQRHAFGDWGIVEKPTGHLIGFSGLHYIADMAEVNIGYALESAYWRQGLASEACRAVLYEGFQERRFATIVAVIWPENTASIQFIQTLGFRWWKTCRWQGGARVVYRRDRDDGPM